MLSQTLNPTQKQYSSLEEYLRELRAEVVEKSGIASDGYHMGKLMYHVLKKHPQAINQTDGVSGEVETNESVLRRTVQLASALTDSGLKVGDVVAVMGAHHLDLCIPVFAAHFIGAAILPLPESSSAEELKNYLDLSGARIVFCQYEHASKLTPLRKEFTFEIVIFDENEQYQTMDQYIKQHSSEKKASDFWKNDCDILPPVRKLFLVLSPLQWQAAMILYISGIIFVTPRVQTSDKLTPDLVIDIISSHKPSLAIVSPTLNKMILEWPKKCDFSCFKSWWIGGSHMPVEMFIQAQLVDPEKGTEMELGEIGELWIKGPAKFKGYLKNPTATKDAITEDGRFKTGDLMHKDDAGYNFYVERLKLMLKCMNQQATNFEEVNHSISPTEIEWVILQLEGVADVVVTSVDSPIGEGDLPVAAVVRKNGHHLTAEQIKQHVRDNLPVIKQLRGGVVFLDSLPLLRTTKVDRRKIKFIVSTAELE